MTRIETIARPTGRRRSRAADAGGGLLPSKPSSIVILLACCCLLLSSSVLAGEPTIPRSTNRYSDYNRQSSPTGSGASSSSSSVGSISSSFSPHDYQPPWNPSPKIDPHGFLADLYPRSPGDWEHLANIRGKYGPRQRSYPRNLLTTPVEIRQVPGDGNCLFHSIAACLHQAANGTHLPMDSHERILELRCKSLELRNAAVDVLQNLSGKGRRKLFLQGDEYLEARELLAAAAAQFELEGEEYCELMRKESYWGGGPEIVALCNHLQRPIHIYEVVPTSSQKNNKKIDQTYDEEDDIANNEKFAKSTCNQFTLRRMACFGSPKYDRKEPLHILSADSRFPDVEPKRIRRVGNHFLALFPVTRSSNGGLSFRKHALIRGGSRIVLPPPVMEEKPKKETSKWFGGQGSWAKQ